MYETGQIRRTQAGLEAVEVLIRSGFGVSDMDITTEPNEATFDLTVTLSVDEMTRPLEALE